MPVSPMGCPSDSGNSSNSADALASGLRPRAIGSLLSRGGEVCVHFKPTHPSTQDSSLFPGGRAFPSLCLWLRFATLAIAIPLGLGRRGRGRHTTSARSLSARLLYTGLACGKLG